MFSTSAPLVSYVVSVLNIFERLPEQLAISRAACDLKRLLIPFSSPLAEGPAWTPLGGRYRARLKGEHDNGEELLGEAVLRLLQQQLVATQTEERLEIERRPAQQHHGNRHQQVNRLEQIPG